MTDKRTVYSKCCDLIRAIKKDTIPLWDMEGLIMQSMGSTQSTIQTALRTMATTGLIKDIGDSKFKVNKDAIRE